MLSLDEVTEEGGEIMDGRGKLMRLNGLNSLEDREFLVRLSDNIVTPNPKQPRKYFDKAKLAELSGTIESQGQKSAIVVVPYFDGDAIKLFIIDGERRLRVLKTAGKEFIRVVIRWAASEEEIFEQSLILNESKADHNPMERAYAYKQLIEFQEKKGVSSPIKVVAKRLGIPDYQISNHLKLLDLPEAIQDMVIHGTLVLKNSLVVRQAIKKYGPDLPIDQLTQALMAVGGGPDSRATKSLGGRGGMTREDVTRAVRGVLAEGGHVDAASELGAQKAVHDAAFGIGRMQAGINRLSGADPDKVVGVLRNRRGEPPELIRDRLDEVDRGLKAIRALVERAIRPDPLEKVPGKPAFLKFMQGKRKSFGNEIRFNMACLLAKSSDKGDGEVMMVPEMAKALGVTVNDIASNLTRLDVDLKGLGIKLDQQTLREKVMREKKGKRVTEYTQRPAYRLKWKVKGQQDDAVEDDAADEPEGEASPARAAAPSRMSMRLEQQPPSASPRKGGRPRGDGDDEDAEEAPARGALPDNLFEEGDGDGVGEVDEDAVAAEAELPGPRGRVRKGDPDNIPLLRAAYARAQQRMGQTVPAFASAPTRAPATPARQAPPTRAPTAPVRASVKPPDISAARHPVSAPEHLKVVAQQIAEQVSSVASGVGIRHCAQFGARLGIKIEERARPGVSAYIIFCNMRAFSTNFGAYKTSFAEWIARAVGKRPSEIEVHLRDVE